MTEIIQPEGSSSVSVEPGTITEDSSSHGGNLIDSPSTAIAETTPLLSSSRQAEILSASQQSQLQVPAADPSILRRNLKIFFFLALKPKWWTFSCFPALLLHWFFALSIYRPAICRYRGCGPLEWEILGFVWNFTVVEILVFFQRAMFTAFHEYRRLSQQERDEGGTELNDAQLCHVCDPTHPQASRLDGLTSAEALAFFRILVALGLVFLMRYPELPMFPTLVWLCYTYGSVSHTMDSHPGPLERYMWRVIKLSILNWQAWLILLDHNGGWDWLWSCVAIHATTGLVWELWDHEGVNNGRRGDLETGGSAAVLPPTFEFRPTNETRSESPGQPQDPAAEGIDASVQQQSAELSITRTVFSVYGERGPRWFSALWILYWPLNPEPILHDLDIYLPNDITLLVLCGLGLVLAILLVWTRSRAWNRRVAILWLIWFVTWLTMPAMPGVY